MTYTTSCMYHRMYHLFFHPSIFLCILFSLYIINMLVKTLLCIFKYKDVQRPFKPNQQNKNKDASNHTKKRHNLKTQLKKLKLAHQPPGFVCRIKQKPLILTYIHHFNPSLSFTMKTPGFFAASMAATSATTVLTGIRSSHLVIITLFGI